MPFQAWIFQSRASLSLAQLPLQWGHAFSGMDTTVFRGVRGVVFGSFNGAMPFQAWIRRSLKRDDRVVEKLQWGHALSGMDTTKAAWHLHSTCWASMGPCPFRHGYGFVWVNRDGNIEFASMGPCPFRHGYPVAHCSGFFQLHCFNGAMPFQAWIHYAGGGNVKQPESFNGAMPFQAWIPDPTGVTTWSAY